VARWFGNMKEKIAVATVSGKAFYLLVKELKRRKVDFISIRPDEQVPPDVNVVITTPEEQAQIDHLNIVVLGKSDDPTLIVDEALRLSQGKSLYEEVVVGLDPGKVLGVALIADGELLETRSCQTLKHASDTVVKILNRFPASRRIVRVGSGVMPEALELTQRLDRVLPPDVVIELVPEDGTSHISVKEANRIGGRDAASAARIAERRGRPIDRHYRSIRRASKKGGSSA